MEARNFEFQSSGHFEYINGVATIKTKTISPQRHRALQRLCNENYHTNVRLKLCDIFDVPFNIKKQFNAIERRHKKNGCLAYADLQLRIALTSDMLNYIRTHYHGAAEHCERYYL